MGAVYQAWDAELGEAVAIKVIRPEVMSDPGAAREIERRFKRELQLARQVTHKNVIRIYDLGEIAGIKYITMSYVEGSDLATVLRKEGTLDVARTLAIIRGVVSGLVAAHSAGVVHRDLKPANIMIGADGEPYLMDFGIARSVTTVRPESPSIADRSSALQRAAAFSSHATLPGAVLGTVYYMAPEQAQGADVDQRADIYALGLIFSDMLLGKRPLSDAGGSALDELKRRMEQAPARVRTIDPTIPEAVDQIIARCLEPDPSARFQTSADLAAELDRLDERGEPIPVKRVIGLPLMAAVVALLLALAIGGWWYQRQFIPAAEHAPVSLLIADFQNDTGDNSFDRTLEPTLQLALEGAGFISAYDRSVMGRIGVAPPDKLDAVAAREIAISQGLGVVISGAVERQTRGYQLSLRAVEAVTGNVMTNATDTVSSKNEIVPAVTRLAATIRTALGDETSESAQMFAMETLNARSLDVIQQYAQAIDALSKGRYEEARQRALKAAELDPEFGSAYGVMAAASRSLGQRQEAENYIKQAVAHLDRVTERERYRIRGLSFLLTGDQQKCVDEYGALISRYAADATAHNNLALCATQLRQIPRAIEEMQRALAVLPRSVRQRTNLAAYLSYNSDFLGAEREALEVQKLDSAFPKGFTTLAFARLGQERVSQATQTYQALQKVSASDAASGLADVALYEGRLSEAARLLEAGAAADIAAKSPDRAADKLAALAYTLWTRGQKAPAVRAAERALANSTGVKTRFLAGRIFALAGEPDRAREVASSLGSELYAEPQAYARIIEANILLEGGDARQAIVALTEGNKLLDTWIGRFDLGRAYLEAKAYLEADAEFDRCVQRRGEAMALFLDEVPTYGYFPPVHYYRGRVREELKTSSFTDSFRTFLAIRGQAGEDPLVADARRRAGQ
jgi:tetratricopeptide (TPR) repeat protein/tRNA A-37 threonylcarbamoyl transferase component Bud32